MKKSELRKRLNSCLRRLTSTATPDFVQKMNFSKLYCLYLINIKSDSTAAFVLRANSLLKFSIGIIFVSFAKTIFGSIEHDLIIIFYW
jgi:hypothetical protein